MKMKKIILVTVDFNSEKETHDLLASLSGIDISDFTFEIIVVDNASKIPFTLHTSEKKKSLHVIRNNTNTGFTGGYNTGISYALSKQADYVLLLNNDTIVDKNFVHELLHIAESDEKIGLVAPKIYFAKGHEFHRENYTADELGSVLWYAGGGIDWNNAMSFHRGVDEVDTGQYDTTEETGFVTGCCMFLKSEVLKNIGVLDNKYFLYFEDADLNIRIKKSGYKIMYAPKSIIWHANAASSGVGSLLHDYYISRNRMLFGMKYAPFRVKIALLRESIRLLLFGRTWQKRGILDFYRFHFGKGSFHI